MRCVFLTSMYWNNVKDKKKRIDKFVKFLSVVVYNYLQKCTIYNRKLSIFLNHCMFIALGAVFFPDMEQLDTKRWMKISIRHLFSLYLYSHNIYKFAYFANITEHSIQHGIIIKQIAMFWMLLSDRKLFAGERTFPSLMRQRMCNSKSN